MFWRAAFLLPFIRIKLRLGGYRKTLQYLQNRLNSRSDSSSSDQHNSSALQMTCRMVRAAEHYSPGQSTCLEQALLLWYLLQTQGIPATVKIGVRKQSDKFEAHAWVEQNGLALNQLDEQHHHYAAFDSELPTSSPPEQP
jgi:hypothetical protein